MRGAAADLMMYLNSPIPIGFVHLLEVVVNMYCMMAVFALVTQFLWVAPFVVVVVILFSYGFYSIGLHMVDPFCENEYCGFNTDKFYRETSQQCHNIISLVPASKWKADVSDNT